MEQTDFLPYEKPTPPGTHVKPIPRDLFIQHDVCVETRWESMYSRGYVTPASLFYIRNHGPTPTIDVNTWRLKVGGPGVAKPLELTYDDILKMPSVTVTRFIECAGNGRIFFKEYQDDMPKGRPWRFGSYGLAEWTGVSLSGDPGARRHQAHRRRRHAHGAGQVRGGASDARRQGHGAGHGAGLRDERGHHPARPRLSGRGSSCPAGWASTASSGWAASPCRRSPSTSSGTRRSTCWPGRGSSRSRRHGGPCSRAFPSAAPSRSRGRRTCPPARRPSAASPWSGYGSITRVEYSLDDGRTWADAEIREPNIALAGCRWEFLWDAPPGEGDHHHPRDRQLGEDAAHAGHHALEHARLRVLGSGATPGARGVGREPFPAGRVRRYRYGCSE